jgi:hypothetical protein
MTVKSVRKLAILALVYIIYQCLIASHAVACHSIAHKCNSKSYPEKNGIHDQRGESPVHTADGAVSGAEPIIKIDPVLVLLEEVSDFQKAAPQVTS